MESSASTRPDTPVVADVSTGIIYRNPKAHVKSVHAYFPSVAAMPNGEMLATYVLGEAFEATNAHAHVARSSDGGRTWQCEGRLCGPAADRITSDGSRITLAPDGQLVANLVRADRTDHPDEGLSNPENLGFVPTELLIMRSVDFGHTWDEPVTITPPLVGPAFELCSPITILGDGRWLLPTSTWRDWEGNLPNGNRMIALVSEDQGRTWPRYMDVMNSPENDLIFWESKIVEFPDGRLLAVAWCYDERAKTDRPNQYTVSHDGGSSWSPPASTGLIGQTMTPFLLEDERVLSIYRRMDRPGLWANLSHLEDDRWVNDGCQPLWGQQSLETLTATNSSMVENFRVLKFGAPCITRLSDDTIFTAFWCYEQAIGIIRWFKFRIA